MGTIRLNYYNLACGKDVTIPTQVGGKKVTEIYTSTFDSMGITSVKIPSSVSTIGQRAFYNNKINGDI